MIGNPVSSESPHFVHRFAILRVFAVFLYEILAAYENVIMKMVIVMDRHFVKHFLTFGCFMIFRWPWRAESIPFIKLCNFVTFRNLGHVERNAMRVWKHAVASSIFQPGLSVFGHPCAQVMKTSVSDFFKKKTMPCHVFSIVFNHVPSISHHFSSFGYGSIPINTIFGGMTIHLPAILMFTRGTSIFHHFFHWISDDSTMSILTNSSYGPGSKTPLGDGTLAYIFLPHLVQNAWRHLNYPLVT